MAVLDAFPGFTFGCDPEFFILNAEGVTVSAHDLLPGTKHEPYKVPGGAIQVDGVAAEFNIDPASSFEEFNHNIVRVMKTLVSMLPAGYKASIVPSVIFSPEEWDRIPDGAKVLGCEPDYNAWTGSVNPTPRDTTERLRTASGHLHIGWEGKVSDDPVMHVKNCNDLVTQLDWYLGGWSLLRDADPVRRRLYGKAGSCRYKPYGVEYRVLSNFWLMTKTRRLEVWNRMNKAIYDMATLFRPEKNKIHNNNLVHRINNSIRESSFERAYNEPICSIDYDNGNNH